MPAPLLAMRGITKRYPGVLANDAVDFEVHAGEVVALLGENGAGKSTLMKVLFGLDRPDAGTIELDGTAVDLRGPHHALAHGIGMVHQHFQLVPDMTVAENVALGTTRGPRSPRREAAESVRSLSARFGLELDPDRLIGDLPVATCQRVEIVKLLHRDARVLILDEPTASVGPADWERLSKLLRTLADSGAAVVFISHKLDEVAGVADRAVVLRHGRRVGEVDPRVATASEMARLMVGRDVVLRVDPGPSEVGEVVLEVVGVEVQGAGPGPALDGVGLEVRQGEVLGVAGVEGNGQDELVRVVTGQQEPDRGEVRVAGRRLDASVAGAFVRAGGGYIPEDRHRDGVALDLSVSDNLALRVFSRRPLARWGLIDRVAQRRHARDLCERFDVRGPGPEARMAQLSGGNQQKAVLAREMGGHPDLLVVAQPTRGLDIGAMEFVYRQVLAHRERGGATLLVSSDLDEVLSLSDRVAVMSRGRIVEVVDRADADIDRIALLMAGAEAA